MYLKPFLFHICFIREMVFSTHFINLNLSNLKEVLSAIIDGQTNKCLKGQHFL